MGYYDCKDGALKRLPNLPNLPNLPTILSLRVNALSPPLAATSSPTTLSARTPHHKKGPAEVADPEHIAIYPSEGLVLELRSQELTVETCDVCDRD